MVLWAEMYIRRNPKGEFAGGYFGIAYRIRNAASPQSSHPVNSDGFGV